MPHLWDDSGKWNAMYQGISNIHVFIGIEIETSIFFLSPRLLDPLSDWFHPPRLICNINSPSLKAGVILV
jgi:hypothetical protein